MGAVATRSFVDDPDWQKKARSNLEAIDAEMNHWAENTLTLGRLFHECLSNDYFKVEGHNVFAEYLARRGFNRRHVAGMARIFERLVIEAGLPEAEIKGADLHLLMEATAAIAKAKRAKLVLEDAKLVKSGELAVADYRERWVDVSFPSESDPEPTSVERPPRTASSRSKIEELVEGVMGWSSDQTGRFLRELVKRVSRQQTLDEAEIVQVVDSMTPDGISRFAISWAKSSTALADETTASEVVCAILRRSSPEVIGRVAIELERIGTAQADEREYRRANG